MIMDRKTIALFIYSLQKGGSQRVIVNLAEYLHKKEYKVILVTKDKCEDEYEINPDIIRVFSEPNEKELQGGRIRNFIVRFCKLRGIWKQYKPNVILSFLGKSNLMAIATSAFLPSRVVVSVRGEPTMEYEGIFMQKLAKAAFGFADGCIFQTKLAQEFFPEKVQKKSIILPNPMNQDFVRPEYTGIREQEIVAVGRMDENKNHEMLIHAFAKIANEYPLLKLTIYGEGSCREKLEALVKEKQLENRISMPGNVTDVANHIEKAKIFALTSNTEGMPNTLMEAMALGLCVVSTDCPCGGPGELIQPGVNGLLVPVGDAFALADAFRSILTDEELASKLGKNARKIKEQMEPSLVNKQWENYLLKMCKS